MNVSEESYEPNITCPFCHDAAGMVDQDLSWRGWSLHVTQTCRKCDAQWIERWELVDVQASDGK